MLDYALVFRAQDPDPERAVIVDISLGGMQTRSRVNLKEGEVCVLSIGQAVEDPVTVTAEVRYSRNLPDSDLFATGFRFLPSDAQERVSLVQYVHRIFQAQGESLIS